MRFVNRDESTCGYKCKVNLSAAIRHYSGTLLPTAYVFAPQFIGFGLICRLKVDYLSLSQNNGVRNPVWHIYTSLGAELLTVEGLECSLDIAVRPSAMTEYANLDFCMSDGEPEWVGLPESNLPRTEMTLDYETEGYYIGTVNGVDYSAYIPTSIELAVGHDFTTSPYTEEGLPDSGELAASAVYSGDDDFQGSYTYTMTGRGSLGTETCDKTLILASHGNSITMEGENCGEFSETPFISASVTSWPISYKYHITERSGLSLSAVSFSDRNGNNWRGASSDRYEYMGVQNVQAEGAFFGTSHSETADPVFTINNTWQISDPAPEKCGGITCLDPEKLNDYSVTVENPETHRETEYKPQRVQIWPPLGDNGDLEGELNIRFSSVDLDTFQSDWDASGCTFTNRTVSNVTEGASLSKSGFMRLPYSGEHGNLTAAELVPHWPLGNIVRLRGSGLSTDTNLTLTITGKERTYTYLPTAKNASYYEYDLTRPIKSTKQEKTDTYYDLSRCEDYEGEEGDPDAKYWIEEKDCQARLYGPTLFTSISFSGFEEGKQYLLSKIECDYKANSALCFFADEFKSVTECGHQKVSGQEHPILRNRHGIICHSGRFAEIPNNQEDITPQGAVSWRFPTVSSIEGNSGSRLIFPRDDYGAISISAKDRSSGDSAINAVSEMAYIGWITGEGKIKPACDTIGLNYFYCADFDEFECFCDIGGGRQGFVNAASDTLDIDGKTINNTVQYLDIPEVSGIDIAYTSGGTELVKDTDADTVPGFIHRWALRLWDAAIHGKIWRNRSGKILRNNSGIVLRGDYEG